jgi:hypothetical protein
MSWEHHYEVISYQTTKALISAVKLLLNECKDPKLQNKIKILTRTLDTPDCKFIEGKESICSGLSFDCPHCNKEVGKIHECARCAEFTCYECIKQDNNNYYKERCEECVAYLCIVCRQWNKKSYCGDSKCVNRTNKSQLHM